MWMQEVPVLYPKAEAVRASAPQVEQSRACLANLHFKFPASCFFSTVYLWIIPLCRPSSRVNPHLSLLKICWGNVHGFAYYSLVSFFVHLSSSSEIQWDINNCSGGAAVLSKTIKQTTFCIKTINITGESEHEKPGWIIWTGIECPGVCTLLFFLIIIFLYVMHLDFCCSFNLKELVIVLLFGIVEYCLQSSCPWISVKK